MKRHELKDYQDVLASSVDDQSIPLWEQADLYVVKRGIIEGKTSQQWRSFKSKSNFHRIKVMD